MDEGGRRRAWLLLGAVAALSAWGVLVALAVAEGRDLRFGDGSWALLAVWCVGAVVPLYAAVILALSWRRRPEPPTPPRPAPRHRG